MEEEEEQLTAGATMLQAKPSGQTLEDSSLFTSSRRVYSSSTSDLNPSSDNLPVSPGGGRGEGIPPDQYLTLYSEFSPVGTTTPNTLPALNQPSMPDVEYCSSDSAFSVTPENVGGGATGVTHTSPWIHQDITPRTLTDSGTDSVNNTTSRSHIIRDKWKSQDDERVSVDSGLPCKNELGRSYTSLIEGYCTGKELVFYSKIVGTCTVPLTPVSLTIVLHSICTCVFL